MGGEIESNKLAAEIAVLATERVVAAATEPTKTALRRALQLLSNAYAPFLEKTYDRVKGIRTFLKPNETIDLISHYISVDLTDKELDFDVIRIIEDIHNGGRIVISGLAGRGKVY